MIEERRPRAFQGPTERWFSVEEGFSADFSGPQQTGPDTRHLIPNSGTFPPDKPPDSPRILQKTPHFRRENRPKFVCFVRLSCVFNNIPALNVNKKKNSFR